MEEKQQLKIVKNTSFLMGNNYYAVTNLVYQRKNNNSGLQMFWHLYFNYLSDSEPIFFFFN